MMSDDLLPADESVPAQSNAAAGYEPPRIESSMTADDIEREVFYAGVPISQVPG